MNRIDCAHLDVSEGIYKSLRSSVSEFSDFGGSGSDALQLPVDSSLTKSEISLLTNYAEDQVANAPQFYLTSLWSWCFGNYNVTAWVDRGVRVYSKHDITIICKRNDVKRSVFDYRGDLDKLGMQSVLSYAHQSSDYMDSDYKKQLAHREMQFKLVLATIFGQGALMVIMLILQYVMYSSRGPADTDLSNLPSFLKHIMAALSALGVIFGGIAASVISKLLANVRSEISDSLKDFGIALHFGSIWFSLLWLGFVFSLATFVLWGIPTWCANPPDIEVDSYMRSGDFKSKPYSPGLNRQRSVATQYSNASASSNPRDKLLYASSDSEPETDAADKDRKIVFDYRDEEEHQLRKLGESLSRAASVRQLNKRSNKRNPSLQPVSETAISREETKKIIYNDQPTLKSFPHYMTDSYDGYMEAKAASASSKAEDASQPLDSAKHYKTNSLHTKNITNNNPFLDPETKRHSQSDSFLDEREIDLLDQSNYFNKL